jgi:hypothetical protein
MGWKVCVLKKTNLKSKKWIMLFIETTENPRACKWKRMHLKRLYVKLQAFATSHLDKCKSVDGCGYEKHCHVFCVLDRKLESKLYELIWTTSELCLNYIWTLSELSLNYIWTISELSLNTIWVKFWATFATISEQYLNRSKLIQVFV